MSIEEFALQHNLQMKHDPDDGTEVIPGREGKSHIFNYGSGLLGVMIMPERATTRRWRLSSAAFLAAGMQVTQSGDAEGCATFDPGNPQQVKLALKYAQIRSKRRLSHKRLHALLAAGQNTRFTAKRTALGRG